MRNAAVLVSRLCVLGALVTAAAPARADVCKNVDINVQNHKDMKIKAKWVEYLFDNDNQWRSVKFPDVEIPANSDEVTVATNKDLAGGEGNEMLAMKLHFEAWCGGKWSVGFVSAEDTDFDITSACVSNSGRVYRIDLPSSDVCD